MLKFFAEKMWVAFAVQKLLTFFQQKISEYCILNPLKQLTKWPLTSSLSLRRFEQLGPGNGYSRAILVVTSECCCLNLDFGTLANSAAPDLKPKNVTADQGLHCLLKLREVMVWRKQSLLLVQDHVPSLHSQTIYTPVLLVIWFQRKSKINYGK